MADNRHAIGGLDFAERWDRLRKEKHEEFMRRKTDFANLIEISIRNEFFPKWI